MIFKELQRWLVLVLFIAITFAYAVPSLHNHNHRETPSSGISQNHDGSCAFSLWHTLAKTTASSFVVYIRINLEDMLLFSPHITESTQQIAFSQYSRAPPILS